MRIITRNKIARGTKLYNLRIRRVEMLTFMIELHRRNRRAWIARNFLR